MLAAEELNISRQKITQKYHDYAEDYIAKHDGELSIKDKETLYKSIGNKNKSILWNVYSSESEFREIVSKNGGSKYQVQSWKDYRIKNNLPITEDLDDDINMEYYV